MRDWRDFGHVTLGGQRMVTASRQHLAEAISADCRDDTRPGERPRLMFDANGHALSLRATDPAYREALDAAEIVHADGGFLATLSRLTGAAIAGRSATTDLFTDLAAIAEKEGQRFFLLGGTEPVNARCAAVLEQRFPGLAIAGRHHGYFTPEEEEAVIAAINAVRPDIVWVGLGKPREQMFALRNRDRLDCRWIVTCGGCFNFVAGDYRRAPLWMQRANLEWLHRLASRPRALFWRYVTTSPHALWLVLVEWRRSGRPQPGE